MRRFETEKPVSPALGFAPRPGGALVADLAAGAGRRARERRDGGRMVVRLDLHEDVDRLGAGAIDAASADPGSSACPGCLRSPRHCRDTPTARRRDGARECGGSCANSDRRAAAPSMIQLGIEDLVAAVLGVRLREHHELDVGRIAAQALKAAEQVIDLIAPTARAPARGSPARARRARVQAHARKSAAAACANRARRRAGIEQRHLGHAIEQRRREPLSSWPRCERTRCAHAGRRCRARCRRTRRQGRTRARCRWPCSTRARSCRRAAR